MPIVTLLVYILIMAIVWWLISAYVLPLIHQPLRTIIIVVLAIIAIVILLGFVGIGPGIR